MRALAAALLLTACSKYYGLEPPLLFDAPPDTSTVLDDGAEVDGDPIDASTDAPVVPSNCPSDYTLINGASRYRVSASNALWLEAAQDCANDGGLTGKTHLIVVTTDSEQTYLRSITGAAVWVGLSDRLSEGNYRWNTSEPTTFPPIGSTAWGAGEPSGAFGQDCVATLSATGQFQDASCTTAGPFVCECDNYPDDPARYTP